MDFLESIVSGIHRLSLVFIRNCARFVTREKMAACKGTELEPFKSRFVKVASSGLGFPSELEGKQQYIHQKIYAECSR